ncbi:MAG: NAD(P) transhydrogenase subunit alpha, partial [Eubacteriales bacterium]|nr:NAD(P) transhydrogenase subunit alpha [Eubacteriales bacterium]
MFGLETIYYQLILLGVFVASTFIGYILINKVPPLLHTPLMSGMNALSGVTVLGALTACALLFKEHVILSATLGAVAIALAMVNVVGGFVVTDKMLGMIAKKRAPKQTLLYVITAVVAAAVVAL